MGPSEVANMTIRMNAGDASIINAINTGMATRTQTMNLISDQLRQNWFANTAIISHASVAGLLARLEGQQVPRVFGLVHDGFDSHVNQGRNTGRLGNLDNALRALITTLSGDPNSSDPFLRDNILGECMFIITSEFGRRVMQNGSGGTDHGFGGMCIVIDGAKIGREQSQMTTGLRNNSRGYYPHLTTEQYVQADDVVHNFMRPFIQRHYGFDTNTMNYILPVR
jgi:uncharacterized protein (DUF1501 family)